MKAQAKGDCGRLIQEQVPAPAQEVLAEQGAIFSCGGVYVGTNRQPMPRPDHFQYVQLPNYQKEVLVFNHQKMYRAPSRLQPTSTLAPQKVLSPQDTIRLLYKESLN